jgi:hypothetical protein
VTARQQPPLATFSLFAFRGAARAWAFAQMGLARPLVASAPGLRFWKLLGSGQGAGFSLRPNFSRYALFAVWETDEAARAFLADSDFARRYHARAEEVWTVRMRPVAAKGAWSGASPLHPLDAASEGPVAVLTRATLRWRKLGAFWSAVPAASAALDRASGRIASIGVGEAPFVRQATFSLWASGESLRDYAYRDAAHVAAIRRTRDEDWYAEELFARFRPVGSEGAWDGRDPLEGRL